MLTSTWRQLLDTYFGRKKFGKTLHRDSKLRDLVHKPNTSGTLVAGYHDHQITTTTDAATNEFHGIVNEY